jgi:protein SCO1/2
VPLWDNRSVLKNRSVLYFGLVALAALAGGFMVSRQLAEQTLVLESGTLMPQPRPLAGFSLTDHQGAPFTNEQLLGRPHLVFFGFTHCPDICPTTLALLAQLNREQSGGDLATLFITVDPVRDDLQTMRRYVDAFGGRLIGLRGEDSALDPLLKSLGAARSVQRSADGGVIVDHSATLYFIDSQGRLAAVFTPPFSLPRLRADLAALAAGV